MFISPYTQIALIVGISLYSVGKIFNGVIDTFSCFKNTSISVPIGAVFG